MILDLVLARLGSAPAEPTADALSRMLDLARPETIHDHAEALHTLLLQYAGLSDADRGAVVQVLQALPERPRTPGVDWARAYVVDHIADTGPGGTRVARRTWGYVLRKLLECYREGGADPDERESRASAGGGGADRTGGDDAHAELVVADGVHTDQAGTYPSTDDDESD